MVTTVRVGCGFGKVHVGTAFAQGADEDRQPGADQKQEVQGRSFHASKFVPKERIHAHFC